MHNYIFDAATNGLLLQADEINPVACKEPRPVYAGLYPEFKEDR